MDKKSTPPLTYYPDISVPIFLPPDVVTLPRDITQRHAPKRPSQHSRKGQPLRPLSWHFFCNVK